MTAATTRRPWLQPTTCGLTPLMLRWAEGQATRYTTTVAEIVRRAVLDSINDVDLDADALSQPSGCER